MPCSCHALALQRSKGMIRRNSFCDPTTVSNNTLHEGWPGTGPITPASGRRPDNPAPPGRRPPSHRLR
eukprot:2112286-Heterocapsa_arctica.AAC.1